MARDQISQTYDNNLLLKDAGLVAASAAAQVSGANKILNLGTARFNGTVIIDTTAVESDTGDEKYEICAEFSASPTFASGIMGGPRYTIGGATALAPESAASPAIGRYELGFSNEINGTTYQYMRLYTKIAGTIATGINYTAFVAKVGA